MSLIPNITKFLRTSQPIAPEPTIKIFLSKSLGKINDLSSQKYH